MQKNEVKEYSDKEFEGLEKERTISKHGEVWKRFEEIAKGKSMNTSYVMQLVTKACKELNDDLAKSAHFSNQVYGYINRQVKNKKVIKRYDERTPVYKFVRED